MSIISTGINELKSKFETINQSETEESIILEGLLYSFEADI